MSGLALGAVAASMLVMPERFIGGEDGAVTGLVLRAPAERIVVRAAPIPPRRVHRAAPAKRRVIVVERRAPVAITISRRIPVRPRAVPPPARKVVTRRPKPPEPAAPRPASPAMQVASASVSGEKDKAKGEKRKEKGEKRKEKKRKKWRDDDERDEDRRHGGEDRHDDDDDGDKHDGDDD